MEQVLDLDAVAVAIERRAAHWRAAGLSVGPVTWADGQLFGHALTTDRGQVRGDYSVGVRVTRGDEEGQLVAYAGGWCDVEYWSGEPGARPVLEAPGYNDWLDLSRFEAVLDRFESLFLDR